MLLALAAALSLSPAQSAPAQPGLTVTIDPGRAVLAVGQPSPVRVAFHNGGAAPAKLDPAVAMGSGLQLRGVDLAPGAQAKALAPHVAMDDGKPFDLPPGSSMTFTIDLATLRKGELVSLCGVYDTADLWFEAIGLKSAPVRIDLVEDFSKTVVVLETTKGAMKLQLDSARAPLAARNMARHVQLGTYEGTRFHRVLKDFMAQGGDPNSKDQPEATWGGGGAPFNGKRLRSEMDPTAKFERGTLAMARNGDPLARYGQMPLDMLGQAAQQGDPVANAMIQRAMQWLKIDGVNMTDEPAVRARYAELQKQGAFKEAPIFLDSSGSQFFVCFKKADHLVGNYTAFGRLVDGEDTLAKIEAVASADPRGGKPTEEIKITKARLEKSG